MKRFALSVMPAGRAGLALCAAGWVLGAALSGTASAKEQARAETSARADWGKVTLSTRVNSCTGPYGPSEAAHIVSMPLTAKVEADKWTAKLSVPYVSVTGPVVEGVGVMGAGGDRRTIASGLGDLTLTVTNTVYKSAVNGTAVGVAGRMKFAAAGADKGLGTGENDYSLAVEPSQVIGPLTVFGAQGYRVAGDPDGVQSRNVMFSSLGGSMNVMEGTSAGLVFDAQTGMSEPAPSAQRALTAFTSAHLADAWKGQLHVSRGLAEDSPEWSGGASVLFAF